MKRMTDLYKSAYFSFGSEKSVYYVDDVKYSGNYNGDFTIYYSNVRGGKSMIWTTRDFNSWITIYKD